MDDYCTSRCFLDMGVFKVTTCPEMGWAIVHPIFSAIRDPNYLRTKLAHKRSKGTFAGY